MMGQETSAKLEENSINKIKNQRDEELSRMDKESPKRKQETKCQKMKKIMQPESSHNSLAQFGRWNNIVFSSIIIVE